MFLDLSLQSRSEVDQTETRKMFVELSRTFEWNRKNVLGPKSIAGVCWSRSLDRCAQVCVAALRRFNLLRKLLCEKINAIRHAFPEKTQPRAQGAKHGRVRNPIRRSQNEACRDRGVRENDDGFHAAARYSHHDHAITDCKLNRGRNADVENAPMVRRLFVNLSALRFPGLPIPIIAESIRPQSGVKHSNYLGAFD